MIREFFFDGTPGRLFWAWSGLFGFLGHQAFKAYLAWAINGWYEKFYDLLQTSIEYGSGVAGNAVNVASGENGENGENGEEGGDPFAAIRARVTATLWDFGILVAPAVVVHPLAGLWRNWWVFTWRRTLLTSYLHRWNTTIPAIEGASQRVHEDTQRFASGIQSCVGVVLNSLFTLGVFCPVLYGLDSSLMTIAVLAALGGLSVSVLVGWPLVGLEVNNQVVEAELRKKLVLLETDPREVHNNGTPYTPFTRIVHSLTLNYWRLYLSFGALSTWLAFYEQVAVILPYVLVAPRLFAARPEDQLTLGQLMKVANSFGRVFDALNVISDRWLEINEWRSCVRRLREFEGAMSNRSPGTRNPLVPNLPEHSEVLEALEAVYAGPECTDGPEPPQMPPRMPPQVPPPPRTRTITGEPLPPPLLPLPDEESGTELPWAQVDRG